jgi:oligopeptide/dipeptide ABC transporter ATP-binding protein
MDFKHDFDVSYLYITHDLAVARYICDRIAVMYQGKIVERGETEDVLQRPLHPYTRALIASVPVADPSYRRPEPAVRASVPPGGDPRAHCRFLDRCSLATARCGTDAHPPMVDAAGGHVVACYEATRA